MVTPIDLEGKGRLLFGKEAKYDGAQRNQSSPVGV